MKNDGTLIVWVDTEDGARVERFVTAKMRSPRRGSCFGPEPPIDPAKHTRKCPTCAKTIGREAKACQYCQHQFTKKEVRRQREFGHAVRILRKELSPNLIAELSCLNILKTENHFGVGLQVRNLLRRGGITWDDVTLDEEWRKVQETVMEKQGGATKHKEKQC